MIKSFLSILGFLWFGNVLSQFTEVSLQYQIFIINEGSLWGNGASFYDFNHDGWDDLTSADGSDAIRFFLNDGAGVLAPAPFFINFTFSGQITGILWFDYDNDNDEDLLVSQTGGRLLLFRNNGDFSFTEVGMEAGFDSQGYLYYGVGAADCNNDGYLDFIAAKYYGAISFPDPIYGSRYYENNGDGTFSDKTAEAGLNVGAMTTFMPVFFDLNNDGAQDIIYVVDRYAYPNKIFINDGTGHFTDATTSYGMGINFDAMCAAFGDFDNDMDYDLFMTNTPNGNFLFQNNDGVYENIAAEAGVLTNLVCWGANWVDYDNNTLQDLFVSGTTVLHGSASNYWYVNNGDGTFTSTPSLFGATNDISPTFCNVIGDVNNDGYYDYYNNNNDPYPSRFWRNIGGTHHYFSCSFKGTYSNYNAFGTRVDLYANGQGFTRYTHGGESFMSQNSGKEIFGLGQIEHIDSLIIRWPRGLVEKYYNLEPDQHIHYIEGASFQNGFSISEPEILICPGQSIMLDGGEGQAWQWNTGEETRVIEVSEPGQYFVTVSHGFNILATSADVVVNYQDPPVPIVAAVSPSCHGWSDGSISFSFDYPESVTTIWEGDIFSETLTGLAEGTYGYVVISEDGCTNSGSVELIQPDVLLFSWESAPALCFGESSGSIIISEISGGTEPYEIISDAGDLTHVGAGEYVVSVLDQNLCEVSGNISIEQPEELTGNASVISGELPGFTGVTFEADGGTPPYFISWNDNEALPISDEFIPLDAGEYAWTITDNNTCSVSGSFTILVSEPNGIQQEWKGPLYVLDRANRQIIFSCPVDAEVHSSNGQLISREKNIAEIKIPGTPGIWFVQTPFGTIRWVNH